MNQETSRRRGRYLRRKAKRDEKLRLRNTQVGSLEKVFTYESLYRAGKKCCKGVRWKASTQNFERHIFSGTAIRRKEILTCVWSPAKYNHFVLCERGKVRPIDAPRIQDRQIHKVFTTKVLLPLYLPEMIHNNGASLPGKGFDFSRKMLMKDLRKHFRKYGNAGHIILLDFRQFFPTVSHEELYKRHRRIILDNDLRKFADDIVLSIESDVGLPLGVEPSQAEMVAFPSPLDNYIKCQLALKHAGHYMDDYYIIVPPTRDAEQILQMIISKAESLKLTVNRAKTRVVPLHKPFKYCKLKYSITNSGRIVVNGNRDSPKRARRKFRAYRRMIDAGTMTHNDLWTSVNGILAYFEKYDDHQRVLSLRRLFFSLFGFSCEDISEFRVRDIKI